MQVMKETPRTDAYLASLEGHAYCDLYGVHHLDAEFARELERELNSARAEIEAMNGAVKKAHEALDACKQFIKDAHIIEAQWSWEPLKSATEAIAKLRPFLKQSLMEQ